MNQSSRVCPAFPRRHTGNSSTCDSLLLFCRDFTKEENLSSALRWETVSWFFSCDCEHWRWCTWKPNVCVSGRTGLPTWPPQGKVWNHGVSPQHRPGRKRLPKYLKVSCRSARAGSQQLFHHIQPPHVEKGIMGTGLLCVYVWRPPQIGPRWCNHGVLLSPQRGLEACADNKLHHLRSTVSISSKFFLNALKVTWLTGHHDGDGRLWVWLSAHMCSSAQTLGVSRSVLDFWGSRSSSVLCHCLLPRPPPAGAEPWGSVE